jgi:hypothetical protein
MENVFVPLDERSAPIGTLIAAGDHPNSTAKTAPPPTARPPIAKTTPDRPAIASKLDRPRPPHRPPAKTAPLPTARRSPPNSTAPDRPTDRPRRPPPTPTAPPTARPDHARPAREDHARPDRPTEHPRTTPNTDPG